MYSGDMLVCMVRTGQNCIRRVLKNRKDHWFENKIKVENGYPAIFDLLFVL